MGVELCPCGIITFQNTKENKTAAMLMYRVIEESMAIVANGKYVGQDATAMY